MRKDSYIHTKNRYNLNWAALEPYSRDLIIYKLDQRSYLFLCEYVHYNPQTTHSRPSSSFDNSYYQRLATPDPVTEFTQESALSYHQIVARPQPWQIQRNEVVPLHYGSFVPQNRPSAAPSPPRKVLWTSLALIVIVAVASGTYGFVKLTTKV